MKVFLMLAYMMIPLSSFSQLGPNNMTRFKGEITRIDSITYKFDNDVLFVIDSEPELLSIIELGILHPRLFMLPENRVTNNADYENYDTTDLEIEVQNKSIWESILSNDSLTIYYLRYIGSSQTNPKTKQFGFLLFRKGLANPTEYAFELYNAQSYNDIELTTYIKGARLEQIKRGFLLK